MQISATPSLWIPAQSPSKKLVLVMHGRGDSPEGFLWLPEIMGFSDVNYLLLQAPDAYYTGFSWYDLPPDQLPGITRSRALLDQVLHELIAQGYPPESTLVFGFSQGCLMTLEWAGRTPHSFAACVGISGYCYDPEALLRELTPEAKRSPWLITHGTFDEVLDFRTTEAQVRYLQDGGFPIDFRPYRKAHTIDEREELPYLRAFLQKALEAKG